MLKDASATANEFMGEAMRIVDKHFVDGYSLNHPELVASVMNVMAAEFRNAVLVKAITEVGAEICDIAGLRCEHPPADHSLTT